MEAKGGDYGETCLMRAVYHGHFDICRLLLDKGAQLEVRNSFGLTPLHFAAWSGHAEVVRLLCDRGADVEAHNNNGSRLLHFAAMNGHISIIKELIEERNAEINARDDNGWTALTLALAIQQNKPDVAAYLVSHGGIQ